MYKENMKFTPEYIIIGTVIVLFILFNTVCATKTFSPYESYTPTYSSYEAFAQMHSTADYTNTSNGQGDQYAEALIGEKPAGSCKKLYGFSGLFCDPTSSDAVNDRFLGTEGKLSCDAISSGLHNSKGGLCLSAEQTALLKTRGGNQSGAQAQIGH